MEEIARTYQKPVISMTANSWNLRLLFSFIVISIPIYFFGNRQSISHSLVVGLELANYILIALLIWINRRNLADFHIDRLSMNLFLLFVTFFRIRVLDSPVTIFLELVLFLFGIFFWIILVKSKIQVPTFCIFNRWNGIAILTAYGFVIGRMMFDPLININQIQNPSSSLQGIDFLIAFVWNMGRAGIIEEIIFRGFLWGTLKNLGWDELRILFVQAFLFWILHLFYIDRPFTFWVAVPLVGLCLGRLAWKSKSVVPSMIAHSLINALQSAFLR